MTSGLDLWLIAVELKPVRWASHVGELGAPGRHRSGKSLRGLDRESSTTTVGDGREAILARQG